MTYKVKYPTMAELRAMSAQQIFNHVAKHLMKQGVRSEVPNKDDPDTKKCVYRGPNGTACAVGCLIPQAVYRKAMEGRTVGSVIDSSQTPANLRKVMEAHQLLLEDLQWAHDDALFRDGVLNFATPLRLVAEQHDLKLPKVLL